MHEPINLTRQLSYAEDATREAEERGNRFRFLLIMALAAVAAMAFSVWMMAGIVKHKTQAAAAAEANMNTFATVLLSTQDQFKRLCENYVALRAQATEFGLEIPLAPTTSDGTPLCQDQSR